MKVELLDQRQQKAIKKTVKKKEPVVVQLPIEYKNIYVYILFSFDREEVKKLPEINPPTEEEQQRLKKENEKILQRFLKV
jgi:hypothetical protein